MSEEGDENMNFHDFAVPFELHSCKDIEVAHEKYNDEMDSGYKSMRSRRHAALRHANDIDIAKHLERSAKLL